MFHSSLSDLQRDDRQDEFPTLYRGNQDELPTTWRVYTPRPQSPSISHLPTRPTSTDQRLFGLRKTTIWLSILAAALLVLGVVGSSVAGSIAMSRKASSDQICKAEQSADAEPIKTISSSVSPSASPLASSSTSSPTSTATSTPLQPSSTLSSTTSAPSSSSALATFDCQKLQTPYAAKITNALFDISCDTQNFGGDFMSFESSTLENCIEACANFNVWTVTNNYNSTISCSIINYDSFWQLGGNCWLKQSGYPERAKLNQSVISASLRE